MASVPEVPAGWVCDTGDKRAILSTGTGKPIELFNSGLVLAGDVRAVLLDEMRSKGWRGRAAPAPSASVASLRRSPKP